MKLSRLLLSLSSLSLVPLGAADFVKLQNTNALNTAAAWSGAAVPGAADVFVWDATYTTPGAPASLSPLGGDTQIAGIRVGAVGGARNAATTQVGFQDASSLSTLTLGASGINMSAATQAMLIQSRLTLGASQTWNVANANTGTNPMTLNVGEDLLFLAAAAGVPVNLGGFTVTKTGAGVAAFSSGHTIFNGNFVVNEGTLHIQSGTSRVTTVGSDVAFAVNTGGTFQIAVQSNDVNFAGRVTLNAGGSLALNNAQAKTLNFSGPVAVAGDSNLIVRAQLSGSNVTTTILNFTGDLTGAANLTYLNTSANFLRMLGDNSAFTGTLTLNGASGNRTLRLDSASSGSAAATWVVNAGNSLLSNGVEVQLGTLGGAGSLGAASGAATFHVGAGSFPGVIANTSGVVSLDKVGPGKLTLTGANTYTGATTVTAGTLVTTTAHSGTASVAVADGAVFAVQTVSPGATFSTPSLSLGSASGAVLEVNVGASGNPSAAPVTASSFTVAAPSILRVSGSSLLPGTFPVLAYAGAIGGQGLPGLTLSLPPRTLGSLADNPGVGLSVTIGSIEQIRWNGDISGVWDADTVGDDSTGTANWKTTISHASTRYRQTSSGTDSVTFDDNATGSATVSLAGTLTPGGVSVSAETHDFILAGPGLISCPTPLLKSGAGSLTVANTGLNSFTGGITLNAGTVSIGDGATPGAGNLAGAVSLGGTLVLNRPDDVSFALAPSGAGTLRKKQASTVTLSGAANLSGPLELEAGKLVLSGGGTVSGLISGAGGLEAAGGTLLLNGAAPNTFAGPTAVSAGTLQLNNLGGVSTGGDVAVTGGGTLAILANEQIPDTATLRILGTSADSLAGTTGTETVANVIVNPSVPTGQLVMRNGFTVTGLATLNLGVLGAASSHTATLNSLVMTGGTLRIAGSGGPSVLNIGPGGITASGGVIEVKFNTNAQDATLNLGGDFTATADIAINNAGFTGANLNVINLIGQRNFDLAAGTTTTVAPDFGGAGTLVKKGAGTLVLGPSCAAAHTGGTIVSEGTLVVNGTIGDLTVDGAASVLAGGGTAGNITANTGATVSPGQGGAGRLTLGSLTLAPTAQVLCEAISNGNNDSLNVTGALTLGGTVRLTLAGGYTPVPGDSFDLFDAATVDATNFNASTGLVLPALPAGSVWNTSAFATTGVLSVAAGNPFLAWQQLYFNAEELGDALVSGATADPDGDGLTNAVEFALGGLPRSPTPASLRPAASLSSGSLRLTFRRPSGGVAGVTYGFKVSDQPGSGWTATTDYTQTVQANGDGTETVTVTFGPSLSPSRFAQLSVGF